MKTNEIIAQTDNHIGTIILNRPEKRNTLSQSLLVSLYLTLQEWSKKGNIWAVIIKGSGNRAFSSGYDILSIPTEIVRSMQEEFKNSNPLELALKTLKDYPFPTIAMLNGYAFGAGLNLAICCDIRVAPEKVKIGMPPAKLGLVYHPEGLKQFIEVVGLSKAKALFLTARTYNAIQAKEMGIIDHLLPETELSTFTLSLANDIASNAPLSLKGTKKIFNMLSSVEKVLTDDQLKEAEKIIVDAFNSEDIKEGQTAFIEKRVPCFKGR